jgi:pyridoxamine 5'-phosphate oxidase
MDIERIRREYLQGGLRRKDLSKSPIEQLNIWLQQAVEADLTDPTAMTVATVGPDGQPSQRIVLLKHCDDRGLVFFTNLGSRKAGEIAGNPKVSAHFAWLPLERQVKICGVASRLSLKEVLKYFITRPRESQLGAWASHQSQPLSSRQVLETSFAQMKSRFSKGEVPLPSFWGGYLIKPHQIEFWQGGANRLHDRFVYNLGESGNDWSLGRLAP